MKKSFLFLLTALVFGCVAASGQYVSNPYPRTISVTGTAEQELVPDEIYVQVELKEYEQKGAAKMPLETIRRQFLSTVRALGIPDSLVSIASYDGYNGNDWWEDRKRRNEVLLASVTYRLKLRSSTQLNALADRLDPKGTHNFQVAQVSHSRITELRRALKIAAVKAAREKAQYLAEAAGATIGDIVTINENSDGANGPIWMQPNMMSNTVLKSGGGGAEDATDFQKIKLKFEVAAVFALK
ncbi:MAG: SIMPL domain-containing protein [Chitinophagaceae bacterium]|nr:MAG: SIMPL domain-containing protein [Chitinophagaceae bacterium]